MNILAVSAAWPTLHLFSFWRELLINGTLIEEPISTSNSILMFYFILFVGFIDVLLSRTQLSFEP